MTDVSVGPLSAEEARVREAAGQAYRVLEGEEPSPLASRSPVASGDRLLKLLTDATREAPLQALTIAFILGAVLARRRR
jgi:hypothetical protein